MMTKNDDRHKKLASKLRALADVLAHVAPILDQSLREHGVSQPEIFLREAAYKLDLLDRPPSRGRC